MSEVSSSNQVFIVEDSPEVMDHTGWWLAQPVDSDETLDEICSASVDRIDHIYRGDMPTPALALHEIRAALNLPSMESSAPIVRNLVSGYPVADIAITLGVDFKKIAQHTNAFIDALQAIRAQQQADEPTAMLTDVAEPRIAFENSVDVRNVAPGEVLGPIKNTTLGTVAINAIVSPTISKDGIDHSPVVGSVSAKKASHQPSRNGTGSTVAQANQKASTKKPKKISLKELDFRADNASTNRESGSTDAGLETSEPQVRLRGGAGMDPEEAAAYAKNADDEREVAPTDAIRQYLNSIGTTDLLTAEEEVTLSKRIEAGLYATQKLIAASTNGDQMDEQLHSDLQQIVYEGSNAQKQLLLANLRLVVSLARKRQGRGLDLLDLIQHGNLGLIRAVEKFDYTKGYKVSTYATWWIKQSITRGMADDSRTIRLPVHKVEIVSKVGRVTSQLLASLGREPSVDEIARETDLTPSQILDIQSIGRIPISLSQPVGGKDDTSEVGAFIEDSTAPTAAELFNLQDRNQVLERALGTLDPLERKILQLKFGLVDGYFYDLNEIAQQTGLKRSQLRTIEGKALSKLRHPSRSQALRQFAS